jgi:protoporphyrinogen oxidase
MIYMSINNIENKNFICCVGNNLATIIGAYEMAKAGRTVKLFTDGGLLGGFFSGVSIEGYDFDLGMILLEKIDKTNTQNISARSSMNSWLTVGERVSNWLDDQIDLHKVDTPEVYIFGKKYPDYIISNRLGLLEKSGVELAEYLDFNSPYHASNKELGEVFNDLSYADASKHNHGPDFHAKYIEPFIRKVTSVGSETFLARYHRFAWAPLYYPETLNSAILGQKINLKEYEFWTTSSGFVGELINNLKNKILMMSNIEIIDKKITSIKFKNNTLEVDGDIFITDHKVLFGLSMKRALDLLGPIHSPAVKGDVDGVSFTIGLALVHRSAINYDDKALFIVDDEFGAYRFTNQDAIAGLDPEWHRISIEANTDILRNKYDNLSLYDAIKMDLSKFMKIKKVSSLRFLKVLNVKNGLSLPSKDFVDNKNVLSNTISSLTMGNAILSGDLVGYGSSSVNNQVMQGLNCMEKLS